MKQNRSKKKLSRLRNYFVERIGTFGSRTEQSESTFLLLFLLLISAIYYTVNGTSTWISENITDCAALIFAATGQTLVLLVRGVDFSIEGTMVLSGCLFVYFAPTDYLGFFGVLLLILIVGAFFGFVNGFFVARMNLPSYFVTFATQFILHGIAQCFLSKKTALNEFLRGIILHNPYGYLIALAFIVVIILLWVYLRHTYYGLSLYAVEQNQVCAYNYGINVAHTKIFAYVFSGTFSALAGGFLTLQLGYYSTQISDSYVFLTLCAALLGGTYLTGGIGSIPRTIVGCFALQLFSSLILSWGVPIYWARLFRSALLIFMIALQVYSGFFRAHRTQRRSIDEYSIH